MPVKKSYTRKSLRQFLETLVLKPKTAVLRLCDAKSKHKATGLVIMLWSSIPKRCVHTKTNDRFKRALYNCILQNPQVAQYPMDNYCLKLSIYGQAVPQ